MIRVLEWFLRLVASIAPADGRERWREEWLGEMHRVARARGSRTAWRFALGAVADARSLRRLARELGRPRASDHGTGRNRLAVSPTDVKLAFRMLVRYPGLTLVGVLGMSVGTTIATGAFTIISAMMNPALPFEEGERIIAIGNWDTRTNNREPRVLHDFAVWRTELRSIEDIGAVRTVSRNVIAAGMQPETVPVAEISASAFRVTRVRPSIGRPLLAEDERAGAPDVIVIGDDVWRRRFGADPRVLGSNIQLGRRTYTIVGVMPAGFGFPEADSLWIPLRLAASYEPVSGPAVTVFGRLSPGATLESAQLEAAAISQRISALSPSTYERLRTRVIPYTHAFTDMDDPDGVLMLRLMQSMIVLLLVVVCVNVAILVYARTATRQGEIAVRAALGASRHRIVGQLFVEALALSGVAAVVALGLLAIAFRKLDEAVAQLASGFPFWLSFKVSGEVAIYIVAFTVIAAAIVGIVPALKATGRQVQSGLQGLSSGGGARMQMGALWTVLIVAQVGTAVAVLPASVYQAWNALRFGAVSSGFASHEFASTELFMDRPTEIMLTPDVERQFRRTYGNRLMEFERRLESNPLVSNVTYSLVEPGDEVAGVVEVDGIANPARAVDYNIVEGGRQGHLVRFNRVAVDFFETFDVPIVTGRLLQPADAGPGGTGVVIDRTFAERLFSGHNPLGRRLRYVGRSREAGEGNAALGRWYEVVGVVNDFPPQPAGGPPPTPRLYHAVAAGDMYPAAVAIRARGTPPSTLLSDIRELSSQVDPSLQLRNLSTLEDAMRREQGMMRLIGTCIIAVVGSVIALSAAGIYALMSFTVARRRKEIGIRAALGADPKQILTGIFSRVLRQLALGAAVGLGGAVTLEKFVFDGELLQGHDAVVLPLVALLMTAVGLLAAVLPARRGLSIDPTEALREE